VAVTKEKLNMDKSMNMANLDNKPDKVIKKVTKATKAIDTKAVMKQAILSKVVVKPVNVMARRYELAYTKLYNELPKWKKHSFVNVTRTDDGLYNEFIANVIALAENETDNILLTA
jgi:hypothetical protein